MLKITLVKNLRKSIKQGHPWLYRSAINDPGSDESELCKVVDAKNNLLAWGYYSPVGDIAVRILSLQAKPPNWIFLEQRIKLAQEKRKTFFTNETTNCYRLINGEGDHLPGLVCDVYSNVAVLQVDGQGPLGFWKLDKVAEVLLSDPSIKCVYHKPRKKEETSKGSWGSSDLLSQPVQVSENGLRFLVDVQLGQKTGFFLDQRDNRSYLQKWCKDQSVVNLFSYTGGFSIYAGAGGASSVTSVDISPKATKLCDENWQLNFSNQNHQAISDDVFDYLKNEDNKSNIVIVDPPSMAHSKAQKEVAINKYIELFTMAAKQVTPKGHLFLSSCTGRVSFDDFYEVMKQSLSNARKKGTVLRYSGQGCDHPFLHVCPEQRYLKFMHLVLD